MQWPWTKFSVRGQGHIRYFEKTIIFSLFGPILLSLIKKKQCLQIKGCAMILFNNKSSFYIKCQDHLSGILVFPPLCQICFILHSYIKNVHDLELNFLEIEVKATFIRCFSLYKWPLLSGAPSEWCLVKVKLIYINVDLDQKIYIFITIRLIIDKWNAIV